MEENKKVNSAVEKVETISNGKEWKESEHTSAPNKAGNVKKSTKNGTKQGKKKSTQLKKEKEAQRRDRRIRLAEIKAERKKQKEELKAAKKAEKEKRKADLAKLRMKKQEEKQKRRDLIKKETKEQRQKRILAEKNAKRNAKKELKQAKEQARLDRKKQRQEAYKEKQRIKQEKRAQRSKEKSKRRSERKGYGGWLAAVISLGCTVLILLGGITLMMFKGSPMVNGNNNAAMSRMYEENFYDLVGYVDSMDANLSKLMVSNDTTNKQKILEDLNVQSNLAVADMGGLPLEDESRYYTTKILNQVGDFASYLSTKLIDGGEITQSDIKTVKEMYDIVSEIKMRLASLSSKLGDGYSFMSMVEKKDKDLVISELKDLENLAVNYPEMIYDGPFSDGLETREAKGLDGKEEISKEDAKKKLEEYFSEYELTDISYVGDTQNGNIQSYNFEARDKNGIGLYAQITKKGGMLSMFNFYKTCEDTKFDLDACLKIGEDFLKSVGIDNMKAVWYNEDGKEVTINFAYEMDDIIYYSDLIKVNVCQERGVVNGMVANNYILNHTKRSAMDEQITESEALEAVSADIDVDSVRLAVIPVGNSAEKLCYEISGNYGGSVYYVYIDAVTGREVNIFKVVQTTEGTLLM